MVNIAIATRDNPLALATVLGSLLAHLPTSVKARVCIVDSSASPIIQQPQLARLLGVFDLTYQHRRPNLIQQRIQALQCFAPSDFVFMMDDDLVIVSDFAKMCDCSLQVDVIFGFKVDAYNDRGYSDYGKFQTTVFTQHAFPMLEPVTPDYQELPSDAKFKADPGFMYGKVSTLYSRYLQLSVLGQSQTMTDNLAAMTFADPRMWISYYMQAWHIGNPTNWWATDAERQQQLESLYADFREKRLGNVSHRRYPSRPIRTNAKGRVSCK